MNYRMDKWRSRVPAPLSAHGHGGGLVPEIPTRIRASGSESALSLIWEGMVAWVWGGSLRKCLERLARPRHGDLGDQAGPRPKSGSAA